MRWCLLVAVFLGFTSSAHAAPVDASPDKLTFSQDVTDGPTLAQTSTITDNQAGFPMLVSVTGPSNSDFVLLTGEAGDCTSQGVMAGAERWTGRGQVDPSGGMGGGKGSGTRTRGSASGPGTVGGGGA